MEFGANARVQESSKARIEFVDVGGQTIAKITYQPGWRWLDDMAPVTGATTCPMHHVGVTLSGRLRVRTDEGAETEIGPGDVYDIPPGHHGWVVDDEPWVAIDFEGFRS